MSSSFFSTSNIYKAVMDLLDSQGIEVYVQSGSEVAIYCPFHSNTNSPACYINTKNGLWQCFNPSCARKGNFRQLYKHMTGKSFGREWVHDPINLQRELDLALEPKIDNHEISFENVIVDYESDDVIKLQPLIDRGYTLETLSFFEIGYSQVKDRIVIPVRDQSFKIVGLIGRAVRELQEPKYLYNKGFKRGDTLFNINNAKSYESVIVCEGSLDALKIHQSGFANVVATLGAKVSMNQISLLRKYFDSILIFSDNDDAGHEMRRAIMDGCCGKEIHLISIPDHLKDPGDMTEKQIQEQINNKIDIFN